MGSGKSSIGKALSKILEKKFIDLDEYILKSTGAPSINSLFSYLGDDEFRVIEKKTLEEALKEFNLIIATGGGTLVTNPDQKISLGNSIIIYLETDFETCKIRATKNNKRPLFRDINKAEDLFKIRKPLYEKLAHITVKSDEKSAKDVAVKIADLLRAQTSHQSN